MYQLQVFISGDKIVEKARATRAAEVPAMVADLQAAHPGCESIVVTWEGVVLFMLDGSDHTQF